MHYQKELDFLLKVYQKTHLNTIILDENKEISAQDEKNTFTNFSLVKKNLKLLKEKCLYKYVDNFKFCYRILLLPNTESKKALLIGPFLRENVSKEEVLKIGEENAIAPHQHKFLLEYYSSLPILIENSHLLILLNTFCETAWGTPSFTITDISKENSVFDIPLSKTMINVEPEQEFIKKEAIERRYAFENQLIRAVSSGQLHLETQFSSAYSGEVFEKRTADPLQNAKNYCIIMNTLLRKGAEQGGVHPVYLNELSSEYALKIENISSTKTIPDLMKEMFRSYCRLVRKHNLRKYTPVVQKTILTIDADLSSDLTLKTLATLQGVSSGYLSAVFKKETGKTLSEYVCTRRMDYAEYLLNTTNLQIQTVALHCGIMDVQYFSKLFKRYKGKTPSSYRKGK
jgi:AraC-like DNA-binding protein